MEKNNLKMGADILTAFKHVERTNGLLPPLPPNIKPVYIRILNAIYKKRDKNGYACISDISKAADILLPNTSKFMNEMVKLNLVKKTTSNGDKRLVYISTTELGEQYIQMYVLSFHEKLETELTKIDPADCQIMIATIMKVCSAMEKVYQNEKEH